MLLLLCTTWTALSAGPHLDISSAPEATAVATRSCTVDELLPHSTFKNRSISPEWSDKDTTKAPYGCDCSYTRARYFCASLESQGYRTWVPRAVSEGICNSVTPSLSRTPLPAGFKVLMYGNSHMRQVVEALMCIIADKVKEKKLTHEATPDSKEQVKMVRGDAPCRQSSGPDWATLVDHHCILEEEVQSREGKDCSDDTAEFYMTNGAIVPYYYAGGDRNKSIENALKKHDHVPWSYYDAVFANSGNGPRMSEESVLTSAFELQNATVPLFWLSEYDGDGAISGWEASNLVRFHESEARYVDISSMTRGLRSMTKGAVEGNTTSQIFNAEFGDPHFCLPGPPDEMALLLLKLIHMGFTPRVGVSIVFAAQLVRLL